MSDAGFEAIPRSDPSITGGTGIQFRNPLAKGMSYLYEIGEDVPGGNQPVHRGPYLKATESGRFTGGSKVWEQRIGLKGNAYMEDGYQGGYTPTGQAYLDSNYPDSAPPPANDGVEFPEGEAP